MVQCTRTRGHCSHLYHFRVTAAQSAVMITAQVWERAGVMTGLDQQFVRNSNYTIVLITGPCLIMVGALEHETFSLQSLQKHECEQAADQTRRGWENLPGY